MANANVSWWQYSRWGWVIARTMRINQPDQTKTQYKYGVVAAAAKAFSVEGNHILEFHDGDTFVVSGSTENDGTYTVASDATFDGVTGKTTIATVEDLSDPSIVDGDVVVTAREEIVVRRFVKFFWDMATNTGTRPWIAWKFLHDGTQGKVWKPGDSMNEPVHVLVKLLQHTVRDLKRTPISTVEAPIIEALFAGTGNRRYGEMGNLI
jgi:hypothetical protein